MTEPDKLKTQWFRWYDKYPHIRAILKISENLPPTVQKQIGTSMLAVVKGYWKKQRIKKQSDVVSPEFVTSVMKSYNKKRWYDASPQLRVALNMILMMPPGERAKFDSQCQLIAEYLTSLKTDAVPSGRITLPNFQQLFDKGRSRQPV